MNRVYRWEDGWTDWQRRTLTLAQTRDYVRRACKLYHVTPPPVRRGVKTEAETEDPKYVIFLETHQNPASALHESAHIICDAIFGVKLHDHCPEWLGIYLWLLEEFKVAPRLALHSSIAALGLSWWPASAVSPSALRNRARSAPRAGTRSSRRHAGRSA